MTRFCGFCGAIARADERFCQSCGKEMHVAAHPAPAPALLAATAPMPAAAAAAAAAAPAPIPAPLAAVVSEPAQPLAPAAEPAVQREEIQWHYGLGGKSEGPIPESLLRAKLREMPPETMVWNPALPSWITAAEAGLKAPGAPQSQPGVQVAATAAAADSPIEGTPIPPNLHWVLLMVLSWVTCGIVAVVWTFRQAAFVKKIDPKSKAVLLLVLIFAGAAVEAAIVAAAIIARSSAGIATAGGLIALLNLALVVMSLVAVFSMRKSIVRYYNTAEPIGLRLSGVMTFFFSILYFQYHLSRIANWKKTGRLD